MCFFSFFGNKGDYSKQINPITNENEWVINNFSDFENLVNIVYTIKSNNYQNESIIIKKKVEYCDQNIDIKVDLSNCIFEKTVHFYNIKFEKDISFESAYFAEGFLFHKVDFKEILNLNTIRFEKTSSFISSTFEKQAYFPHEFKENIEFINNTFNGETYFNCVFTKEASFSGSTFNNKVRFHHCEFHYWVKFENTKFNDLIEFYVCTFKEPQQFHKTDFNRVAIFSNSIFEQEAQFIYCKTDISSSYLSFQSAKFKKGFDIARANFNCKVSCWDIQVEDKGLLEAINSDYYFSDFDIDWLNENRNDKEELAKWTPASKKLRESMRFIKNNFYAENNRIEGSQFEKKELEVYKKEFQNNTTEDISSILGIVANIIVSILLCIICPLFIILLVLYFIGAILYYGNDLFSLYLNKLSNNFGTSWIRGIVFTISAGIITFLLMAIISKSDLDFSVKGFERMINNFLKIINLLDTKPFEEKDNNKDDDNKLFSDISALTYLIFILGRIFIGYGYYQTIQAFRKYGKS